MPTQDFNQKFEKKKVRYIYKLVVYSCIWALQKLAQDSGCGEINQQANLQQV